MSTVNTVLGPVDVADLGVTLMHEHLLASSAGVPYTFPELVDREGAIAAGVRALTEAAAEGVGSYVDVTTVDLGRDVAVLRAVAEQSGVHVIAATGIWLDIPRTIVNGATIDQVAQVFIREIEVGIEGTGVKAGVIKVATSEEGVTPANELVLRAAARACNQTGVPITTHTAATARVGDNQVVIFQEEGVDLERVCIGHSNDTDDVDYLAGLARQGCLLGMDHFLGGRMGSLDWEERVRVIKRLVDMGLADRVTLSHDNVLSMLALPGALEERRAYNPDGISFISRKVVPRLRELGVGEEAIHIMTVDAPRRFLAESRLRGEPFWRSGKDSNLGFDNVTPLRKRRRHPMVSLFLRSPSAPGDGLAL